MCAVFLGNAHWRLELDYIAMDTISKSDDLVVHEEPGGGGGGGGDKGRNMITTLHMQTQTQDMRIFIFWYTYF